MNVKYCSLIFFLIFVVSGMYSQSFNSSLIAEGSLLSTNIKTWYSNLDDKEFISGYGISYSGKLRLGSNYQLEIRPGLFFTQTFYEGFQLGLYLRRNISEQFFGIVGVNAGINFNGPWRGWEPNTPTFTAGVTIGSKLSEDFSVLFSFDKTLDDLYGHGSSSTADFSKYLFWLMKLGIEYNL